MESTESTMAIVCNKRHDLRYPVSAFSVSVGVKKLLFIRTVVSRKGERCDWFLERKAFGNFEQRRSALKHTMANLFSAAIPQV